MFADWSQGEKLPALSRSVSPDKVSAAVITAVERDRAEIIVARGLAKAVDVTHAISPWLTTTLARKGGVYEFLQRATDRDQRR
jgi:hypothetical protein